MSNVTADEILTQKHKRAYIQWGGAKPGNPVAYAGQDAQYLSITGVSNPESGGVDPIWVHDPRRQGLYRMVARSITAPDIPQATVTMKEKHGLIPRQLTKIGCKLNLYEPSGTCKSLQDFMGGWSDYVMVYSGGIITDKDLGDRVTFDSDDSIEDVLTMMWGEIYPLGSLAFGEQAATQVEREVIDIVYGDKLSCGDCGVENDGTNWIYAITKSSGAGSPGLPAELVYTVNGGAAWTDTGITGLGVTEEPVAIEIVGPYLMVLGLDAYYYAEINQQTGVPGAFTKVTTGFVAANSPNDIYVASPREVFFAGDGGVVYKMTNIDSGVVINNSSATSENLQRIAGADETIVAVGANGAVIKSINRGRSWAATTASPVVASLTALAVIDQFVYWVGTGTGYVYYTKNGGETWTVKTLTGFGAGSIGDIIFPNGDVGYIAHASAAPLATLWTTFNGGEDWTNKDPRILNWPVFDRANRLATPQGDSSLSGNNLAIAGLGGNGTDGIILVGVAGKL